MRLTLFALIFPCTFNTFATDIVIANGRVMDPETGLDAIRNIAIEKRRFTAISEESLAGDRIIDAKGFVVAPGFIDLHAHGQGGISNQFQAADGVTTALELEMGVYPVAKWYASQEGKAPINFGASVSHPFVRGNVFAEKLSDAKRGRFPR
ncbi:MAG: amidohydrolase family protein [Pseudomonadales bacterium]|nr:amidohydrolase family protein [Pseudomonadales bacterium]MDG1443587.1 amidohydrolase family protein [Pseudomonadales bacterium]